MQFHGRINSFFLFLHSDIFCDGNSEIGRKETGPNVDFLVEKPIITSNEEEDLNANSYSSNKYIRRYKHQ